MLACKVNEFSQLEQKGHDFARRNQLETIVNIFKLIPVFVFPCKKKYVESGYKIQYVAFFSHSCSKFKYFPGNTFTICRNVGQLVLTKICYVVDFFSFFQRNKNVELLWFHMHKSNC